MADTTAQLRFTVTNQILERTDSFVVVESSEKYLYAEFTPTTDEWEGLFLAGIFIDEDGTINAPAICANNICAVPETWLKEQKGRVSLLGFDASGTQITTKSVKVTIYSKGYDGDPVTDDEDDESFFDQLITAFAASMDAAALSAQAAKEAATLAESWAVGGTDTRDGEDEDNAKYYAESAKSSSDNAAASEKNANLSAVAAEKSEEAAATSELTAKDSADAAEKSAEEAAASENSAADSAREALKASEQAASTLESIEESKEELNTALSDAKTQTETLEQDIEGAGQMDSALLESVKLARDTDADLTKSTEAAGQADTILTETIRAAGDANAALTESIEKAENTDTALKETIDEAGKATTAAQEATDALVEAADAVAKEETAKKIEDLLEQEVGLTETIVDAVEKAAKEETAESIEELLEQITALTEQLVEKADQTDGFSFLLNDDGSVSLSYTDPDTGEEESAALPTESTLTDISGTLDGINDSLKTILAAS